VETPPHEPGAGDEHSASEQTLAMSTPLQRYAMPSGEIGSAGGQTLIVALLPILLAPHAPSAFWIGAVIATEGLFSLVLPYVAGASTDSLSRRFRGPLGRRGLLLALAAPPMALALVLMPFRDSFWSLAGAAVVYFAALHLYATPLRALLIEANPESRWGSVQGVLGAMHLGGVAFGLVAGGLLFSIWEPLPFVVGGVLLIVTTAVTLLAARSAGWAGGRNAEEAGGEEAAAKASRDGGAEWHPKQELQYWRELLKQRRPRRFLISSILWNAGIEGMRPYIFLFATVVLGVAVQTASLALIGFLVAAMVGSVVIGRIGDRVGRERLLVIGAVVTGGAMLPGYFIRDLMPLIILLIPAGLGAAALISLPYAVFEGIVENDDVGRSTGTFFASVGVARLFAPLVVGAAIDLGALLLPDEQGYPFMWLVTGALVLLGALILHRTRVQ
jgi:MFS transporter, DHA1 family, multidrug resistance protein